MRSGHRARERFIRANLRLVVKFATRLKIDSSSLEILDVIQEGNIGLAKAVERFDPARGYRFSTFAYWWIRQVIGRAMERTGHTVSMNGADAERLARVGTVQQRLRVELNREPTEEDTAAGLGITLDHFRALVPLRNRCTSLDAPVAAGGQTLLTAIADDRADGQGDPLSSASLQAAALLEQLPPIPRRLLERYRGIGCQPVPVAVIAKERGISQAAVRRLIAAAERQLQLLVSPPSPDPPATGRPVAPPAPVRSSAPRQGARQGFQRPAAPPAAPAPRFAAPPPLPPPGPAVGRQPSALPRLPAGPACRPPACPPQC